MTDAGPVDGDVDLVHAGSTLVASLHATGIHFMTGPISAVPAGKGPADLDWRDQEEGQLEQRLTWVSLASEWGLTTASVIRLGIVWKFGGRDRGTGRHIRDAHLYAEADSVGLGQTFRATGGFEVAHETRDDGTVELSATIQLDHYYLQGLEGTRAFDIKVRGDGSGEIRPRTHQ